MTSFPFLFNSCEDTQWLSLICGQMTWRDNFKPFPFLSLMPFSQTYFSTDLSAKTTIEICCVLQVRSKGEQMDAGGLNEHQETGSRCGCSGRLPVRCGRLRWDVTVKYRCAAVLSSSKCRRVWVDLLFHSLWSLDTWEKRTLDPFCESQIKRGQEVCSTFFLYQNYTC